MHRKYKQQQTHSYKNSEVKYFQLEVSSTLFFINSLPSIL